MLEDYEESISLTLRTRNAKKPLRMLARSWKHQWLPLCLARQARHVSMGRPVAKPMRSNQNFACILEASESTRLRMEDSLPNYHEDHIAGQGGQFTATLEFGSQTCSYASSNEDTRNKSSCG